jgi:1-deoxy-D-xylulose-5-phosphate reductoisomerase
MQFEPPRHEDFPLLGLAYRAAGLSGRYTIAFNAANEEAVAAFLNRTITFQGLAEITAKTLESDWSGEPETFEDVVEADALARSKARGHIKGFAK